MFDLWMAYLCVCAIKLTLKLRDIPKLLIIVVWQRDRTGVSALLRVLMLFFMQQLFDTGAS